MTRIGLSRRLNVVAIVLVIAVGPLVACATIPPILAMQPAKATKTKNCHATKTCTTTTTVRATTTTPTTKPVTTTTHVTTTTLATTTTKATTTTQPATTTTQVATTTTTNPGTSTFMSYPLQTCTTSISGQTNVVVSNKSWRGCRGSSALVVFGSHNVYLHDLDFDSNSGDIFLIGDSGQIRIENIRARNTGAGRTQNGSGQGEVIQLNGTFDDGTGGIRHIKSYGGNTEDMISIFQSGGVGPGAQRLVIGDVHEESPLPGDPLAWSSGSGTCINLADANKPGTGHILLQNSTFKNCGQAGIQMNVPTDVTATNNIVYGAARASSNVGLTQWAGSNCSACTGNAYVTNRVWWVKANGSASPWWLSGTATVAIDQQSKTQDTSIDPASLHVVL